MKHGKTDAFALTLLALICVGLLLILMTGCQSISVGKQDVREILSAVAEQPGQPPQTLAIVQINYSIDVQQPRSIPFDLFRGVDAAVGTGAAAGGAGAVGGTTADLEALIRAAKEGAGEAPGLPEPDPAPTPEPEPEEPEEPETGETE